MTAKVELQTDGCLKLSGSLNFTSVAALYSKGLKLLREKSNGRVDLTASTADDSSGLALLLEWYRFALKHHQLRLQFVGVPKQLMAIAKVSGLDKILSFQVKSCND